MRVIFMILMVVSLMGCIKQSREVVILPDMDQYLAVKTSSGINGPTTHFNQEEIDDQNYVHYLMVQEMNAGNYISPSLSFYDNELNTDDILESMDYFDLESPTFPDQITYIWNASNGAYISWVEGDESGEGWLWVSPQDEPDFSWSDITNLNSFRIQYNGKHVWFHRK